MTALSILAFVPSCTAIMSVLDSKRFGVFHYTTFYEVDDFRVERYLPPAAQDITVDKYAQGFRAKFTITQPELDAYMDRVWRLYGDRSVIKREKISRTNLVDEESHDRVYGDLGWTYLDDAFEMSGPAAPNSAGFTIWYSPSKQIAYERAGYW